MGSERSAAVPLEVTRAEYVDGHRLFLRFNDASEGIVDLGDTIKTETRAVFQPLKDEKYFRQFRIVFNTVVWENEADFAPEFLHELAQQAGALRRAA